MDEDRDTGQQPGFTSRHEWTLVGLLALLTFLLGCFGYAQQMAFEGQGGPHTWWDVTYASLKLFIFEAPDETAGWPVYLQVARALAPLVVIYTAAAAVWNHVHQEVALYWLLFRKRRFVVVCGIGETGFRIAKDYCLNSEKQVVVVDLDPLNAAVAELQRLGAIALHGNAMDPLVMSDARAIYAKELFLCTSDDKANIAIAKNVERLTRSLSAREVESMERIAKRYEDSIDEEPPQLALRCFLCVDTPDIYEVFSAHSFFESNSSRFTVRLVNRRETMARNIFRVCAPDLYYQPTSQQDDPMHILFIGFGALVREMILQTALTAHYTDFRRTLVSILCSRDQEEAVGRFRHRYPHLEKVLEWDAIYMDPMTVEEDRWRQLQARAPFRVCYVGMQRDVEGILCARRLNRLRRHGDMAPLNFIVCLNQQNFLAEIIDDDFMPITLDKRQLPDHEPIEYFETLDETISIEIVVDDGLDLMARTLHNAYLKTQLTRGESAGDNASLIRWADLPAHKKKANQNAAAHIDVKLRQCRCVALGDAAASAEVSFPPDEEWLERLAQLEHRRWMADKYLAGYSYGETRDEDRMLHPDLIPWEQLPESDREKDRDNIREIPRLLAQIHQKVCCLQQ